MTALTETKDFLKIGISASTSLQERKLSWTAAQDGAATAACGMEHAKTLRTSARITAGFPTPLPMTATPARMFRKPTATREEQRLTPAAASRKRTAKTQ